MQIRDVRQKMISNRYVLGSFRALFCLKNSAYCLLFKVLFIIVTNRQHLTVTPEELAGLHFLSTNVSELKTKHQAYRYGKV